MGHLVEEILGSPVVRCCLLKCSIRVLGRDVSGARVVAELL